MIFLKWNSKFSSVSAATIVCKGGLLTSYVFVSYLYTSYILCFLSGPVSWIHWWLNFMSSWVILQTTKALILKTFPMVRISDGKSTPKEPIPRLWIALELGLTPLKESTLIVDSFAVLLAVECTILAVVNEMKRGIQTLMYYAVAGTTVTYFYPACSLFKKNKFQS